jgi:hypothetical protein
MDFSGRLFTKTKFYERANFQYATFMNLVDFRSSEFVKVADFHDSTFEMKTYFLNITFNEKVYFNNAIFSETADFHYVDFQKGGSFNDCSLPDANFSNGKIQCVSFQNVIMNDIKFDGAEMENSYLAEAKWNISGVKKVGPVKKVFLFSEPLYTMVEELNAKRIPSDTRGDLIAKMSSYKIAMGTYRRIKLSLSNEGDYEKAGDFFIKEKEMNRVLLGLKNEVRSIDAAENASGEDIQKRNVGEWVYQTIQYHFSAYGERPSLIARWSLIIISIFAFIYCITDVYFDSIDGISFMQWGRWENVYIIFYYLYFSIVTFTTLGYGDVAPTGGMRFVAACEAVIGALLIAYFVVSLARKVMR